jgi:RNA polymerase sigma-70 factor (ECF subfamily)
MRQSDFERLFDEHAQPLFAFLVYRTGDRGLAEDVVADTFEKALRSKRLFNRRKASEKTWLYTIALNRLRDCLRRRSAEGRALETIASHTLADSVAGTHIAEAVAERDSVARALARLSDAEREAIALRFGAELTCAEMSRVLGQPLTTVEGRVYRALRKLREDLS